jgi:hypothetical protein
VTLEKGDGWYYAMCTDVETCGNDAAWGRTEDEAVRVWNETQSDLLDVEAERREEAEQCDIE